MKTVSATTIRFVHSIPFLALALAMATGCGQKEPLTLQDGADFSGMTDLFAPPAGVPTPETILARVGDRTITQGDLQRETTVLLMARRNRIPQEDLATAAQQLAQPAFQSLVRKALLLDAIEAKGVQVEEALIDERLVAMREQVPEGQDWDALLEAQGLDEASVREQVAASLRIDKLVRENMTGADPVADEDIRAFYEANPDRFIQPDLAAFSHILFRLDPEASEEQVEEVRLRAERLQGMIGDQVEFGPLAARYSDDEATKEKGGYVGKVAEAQLQPALRETVFGSETGTVNLVRTPGGFHLVRVESREASRPITLEEATPAVSNLIAQQRSREKLEDYFKELEAGADIEIIGQVPAGAQP